MKKFFITLITLISISLNITAAVGDWKIYMSYSEPQQIQETGNYLFVQASNSLYLYNKNDQSIQTFDKTTGMSDVVVTNISWNQKAKRLVVVYDNSNIDLIDLQGNVTNVPDLYNKSMTEDKTVNSIINNDKYAYIATNFGGIKLNVASGEVYESYLLGQSIKRFAISGSTIYAQNTQNKAISASMSTNLQDKANWESTPSYPDGIFNVDNSAYTNNIELVKTLKPNGPKYNYFGFLKLHENKLYTCNGGKWDARKPASIQIYDIENNEWTTYKNEGIGEKYGIRYYDILTLDIDPRDSKHLMAGMSAGLFEFYDGELINYYNSENSPIYYIPSLVGHINYQMVTSLHYDTNGDLYIANSSSEKGPILILDSNNKWKTIDKFININNSSNMKFLNVNPNEKLWVYTEYWDNPAVYSYDFASDKLCDYSNYVNQDGTAISGHIVCQSTAEDLDGNIWVGLNLGLYLITGQYNMDNPEKGFYQIKVPRNDGTNLADYLMYGVDITAIAIDKANRKWIGTNGNGIYLISADNMVQEKHINTMNSPLLSDVIQYITIDDNTGRVYIGTDKGLCSYQSEVTLTNEEMDTDNVWVYPNPVTPEYQGMINVTGLSFNSDVKITSSNGTLVAQGRSTGGSFSWDGKDLNGKRVASGVYMVHTAKSDGSKGTVCKVTIIN